MAGLLSPNGTSRQRTVADLRPRKAFRLDGELTVAAAAKQMASANVDAALIVSLEGELLGILTDTDVARKVLGVGLDPAAVKVIAAMTPNPTTVAWNENAVDALVTMVEKRFRHLSVMDEDGAVGGVLDIAKCLYDAISRLEKHLNSASTAMSSAMLRAMPGADPAAVALVDSMVTKLFSPPLSELLEAHEAERAAAGLKTSATIPAGESVQSAAAAMAARTSALLVSQGGQPCAGSEREATDPRGRDHPPPPPHAHTHTHRVRTLRCRPSPRSRHPQGPPLQERRARHAARLDSGVGHDAAARHDAEQRDRAAGASPAAVRRLP